MLFEYLLERMKHGLSSPFNKKNKMKIKQTNKKTYTMDLPI